MSLPFAQICEIIFHRRQARHPLIENMMNVRERANGDWVLPDWNIPNVTPALVADAIDNLGLRAAEVPWNTYCPSVDPGKPRADDRALARRKVYGYTLFKSDWQLQSYRFFRHLAGYATAAIDVQPDFDMACPLVKVRDPLHAFPEPKAPEDVTPPADCGFIYGKSAEWIRAHYPAARDMVHPSSRSSVTLWDMVEWIDEDDIVIGILGPRDEFTHAASWDWGHQKAMEVSRTPNKAGMCTVVVPERVTLDRIVSSVSLVLGIPDLMAKLLALDILGAEKSVIPDRYIIGANGMTPTLVGGTWQDGRTGNVNLLTDTAAVGEVRGTPDPNNKVTMDRLEQRFRNTSGLIPQYGGENFHGVRTGRAMDSLSGAALDPRVRELHILASSKMPRVNEAVAATFEGYWPTRKYTVFSGWPTDTGFVEFTPKELFETRENIVSYPVPGSDMITMTQVLGQMFGAGFMSRFTAMQSHPWIPDAESELRKRAVEDIDEAIRLSVLNRSQLPQGGLSPRHLAYIAEGLEKGESWRVAVLNGDDKIRKEQSTAPDGTEVQPPETVPGMANPGEGAESPMPPAVGPPEPSLQNVQAIMRALAAPPAA